ncbi:MAG: hypothetical protein LIP77_00345 [Planctomycetes bacterium]|nr:hypothetical protein [Planctomycetota bacterium]
MNTTAQERTETVVRNILSGKNGCGTLQDALVRGDADFFRRMVRPVIGVYEEEAQVLREQRDAALRDAEVKRVALEAILSTLPIPAGPVHDAVARALPSHPFL